MKAKSIERDGVARGLADKARTPALYSQAVSAFTAGRQAPAVICLFKSV